MATASKGLPKTRKVPCLNSFYSGSLKPGNSFPVGLLDSFPTGVRNMSCAYVVNLTVLSEGKLVYKPRQQSPVQQWLNQLLKHVSTVIKLTLNQPANCKSEMTRHPLLDMPLKHLWAVMLTGCNGALYEPVKSIPLLPLIQRNNQKQGTRPQDAPIRVPSWGSGGSSRCHGNVWLRQRGNPQVAFGLLVPDTFQSIQKTSPVFLHNFRGTVRQEHSIQR